MNLRKLLMLLAVAVLVYSCKDKGDEPVTEDCRTILVYMAANNSLGMSGADQQDLAEMARAAKAGAIANGNLLIFHAATDGSQRLYRMDDTGALKLLKEYDGTQYAISSDLMLQVFRDAKSMAPARDYGLIMWSHALGWTQNGQVDNGPDAVAQSWGDDRGHTMNISTLQRVLGASPWSFVYFDCCYMGCVEVAYQLSPVLDRMVASASEIPLDGMPYEKNLPLLFGDEPDLTGAARNTFEYYNSLQGSDRTCTIGVFDLRGMDALAAATRAVYRESDVANPSLLASLPLSVDSRPLFYDFGVFVNSVAGASDVSTLLTAAWQRAYDDVVLYFEATPMLWDRIDLAGFTGMSTFIPRSRAEQTLRGYDTLSWYEDVACFLFPSL